MRAEERGIGRGSGRFAGRRVLVTGASRGIGRAIALRFGGEGASVVVHYVRQAAAASEIAGAILAAGGQAVTHAADLADPAAVERLADHALDVWDGLDVLVNNAAESHFSGLLDLEFGHLDRLWAVNVKAPLRLMQRALPAMQMRRSGSIVNIASVAAFGTSMPGTTAYAMTKAALVMLTRRAAYEVAGSRVRVNAVCPGGTDTDMMRDAGGAHPTFGSSAAPDQERVLLGRLGNPDEIASVVTFLASDEASFMTGQALAVDGGRRDLLGHSG